MRSFLAYFFFCLILLSLPASSVADEGVEKNSPQKRHDIFQLIGAASDEASSSTWKYRVYAEKASALLLMSDRQSISGGMAKEFESSNVEQFIEWMLSRRINEYVWWAPDKQLVGDPNTNRFILLPLLEMAYSLKRTGFVSANTFKIYEGLKSAVDYQVRVYSGGVAWDSQNMTYPNQDIYFALIMTISSRLYERPDYQLWADKAIAGVERAMTGGGGFYYIGNENPSPIYQALLQVMLARYYKITGSDRALKALKYSSAYWKYAMSDAGDAEAWSDAWWKQGWIPIPSSALSISAAVSKSEEMQLRYLSLGGRMKSEASDYWWQYALEWPNEHIEAAVGASEYLVEDRAIRGVRARSKDWYYGMTQGGGLRNTFVGGMISTIGSRPSLNAAFRGAQIEAISNNSVSRHGQWLSQKNDQTDLRVESKAAALVAAYTLQPSTINASTDIQTPKSSWQVRQLWAMYRGGIMGSITLKALAPVNQYTIVGRLPLGPCDISRSANGDWGCGQLKLRFYRIFGVTPSTAVMPAENPSPVDKWPGLLLKQSYERIVAGQEFTYAVWVGPSSVAAPNTLTVSSHGESWDAMWDDGAKLGVAYKSSKKKVYLSY